MVQRRSAPRGMVMASDQPPDCPFTRYLHHFGAPTPVYFMLHHMYFTYCIIIFILYTLRYFVLYTIYYVRYTIYYILYTIYYILYIYICIWSPQPHRRPHTAGGEYWHIHRGRGPIPRGGQQHGTRYHIYIIMYVTIYIYTYICICAYCMRMGSIYLVLATSRVTYLRTTSPEIMNRIWESSHNDLTSHQFTRSQKIDGRDHLQEPPDIWWFPFNLPDDSVSCH